jgi:hypothetical protein
VVILDEVQSLLVYITDTYDGKEHSYFVNLNLFVKALYQKKIVLSDAFLIDFPIQGKTLGIYNTFREDLTVYEYTEKDRFISTLIRKAKINQESIVVSANEKRILRQLEFKLKECCNPFIFTAETENKAEKLRELRQSNEYKVIMYSPTITTGVSFLGEFQEHFHYDSGTTTDAISSVQMIRRSRNAKIIHFFVKAKSSFKVTDLNKIEKFDSRVQLFTKRDDFGFSLGLTLTGKFLAKCIQIKNILSNTSTYAFKEMLSYQFKEVNLVKSQSIHGLDKISFKGYKD